MELGIATPGARPPIVEVLRDAIRQRLLPPGMPLVQRALADALGTSRIPVRDALQQLATEGLVTVDEDGARVTELTPDEVDELWSLRALIEPAMAAAIVRNAGPADVSRLDALVREMDGALELDRWSNLNHAFHESLYRLSALRHHATVARRVLTLIEPISRVTASLFEGRDQAQAEHREMIAALRDGDADALRSALERHSTRARARLVEHISGGDAPVASGGEATAHARALAARFLQVNG